MAVINRSRIPGQELFWEDAELERFLDRMHRGTLRRREKTLFKRLNREDRPSRNEKRTRRKLARI
ncbi:MAG: hypothetical protein OES46_21045 [Gammaproteobacteria bacterium]|nr:hypothetical protein [Gammaproteobacteria bacterium]